jgi:hypothetical protein
VVGQGVKNGLGFSRGRARAKPSGFDPLISTRSRLIQMNGMWSFGLLSAQVGTGVGGLGLRRIKSRVKAGDQVIFSFWNGRTGRVFDGRTIERSGDAVSDLYHAHEDEKREFLGWATKSRSAVCEWFAIKIGGDGFLLFDLKTGGSSFPVCALKPVALVSWFGTQNHRNDFLVCASK